VGQYPTIAQQFKKNFVYAEYKEGIEKHLQSY
jgi:hypothetical protein